MPSDLQEYVDEDNTLFTNELQQWDFDQAAREAKPATQGGHPAYGPWMPAHYSSDSGTKSGTTTSSSQTMTEEVPKVGGHQLF